MQKLEVVFARGVTEITLDSLMQWDKDILLHISDEELPETFEIHIGYEGIKEADRFPVQKIDGVATVKIPNKVLQQTRNIKAWIYVIDSEGCRTTKTILIPIEKREKPADYTTGIEPSQKDAIERLIETLNDYKTSGGTVVSQNADFAEVAEWNDGNPNNEDRTGYFVCANVPIDGIVMKKATSVDDVKGVTILNPAFAGNYSKDKLDSEGNLLPKYSFVAIIGFVPVIDNGTCTVGGRCMPDDNGCAIPSNNSMGYQVVNRIDENRVLIIIEPNGDMVQRIKTKINDLQNKIENMVFPDGSGGTFNIDDKMSNTSTNPVQNKVAKAYVDAVASQAVKLMEEKDSALAREIEQFLAANVVIKQEGKGLSSNDFTNEDKAKLDSSVTQDELQNYIKQKTFATVYDLVISADVNAIVIDKDLVTEIEKLKDFYISISLPKHETSQSGDFRVYLNNGTTNVPMAVIKSFDSGSVYQNHCFWKAYSICLPDNNRFNMYQQGFSANTLTDLNLKTTSGNMNGGTIKSITFSITDENARFPSGTRIRIKGWYENESAS